MAEAQFHRVAERGRATVTITVDGAPVTALDGDTVLTALLLVGRRVRTNEFDGRPRAGFCVMGACQDCWVRYGDGTRGRACTTYVADGMAVFTTEEMP